MLAAKDLPHEIAETPEESALRVPPHAFETAREEISRYEQERRSARRVPATVVPYAGAGVGVIGYVAVLLTVAYCTGISLFDVDWLAAGSLDARSGVARQWWRAITALTLHLDQLHLFGNLLFGVGFGYLAGRLFGPGVAWLSILAAGTLGNYADMLISPPTHRAVGASTAVFAAVGLVAGFSWGRALDFDERFRYRWAPLFAGVCLLIFLGAGGERVDVLGHVLGFCAGIALGWAHVQAGNAPRRGPRFQAAAGAAALVLITAAWICALRQSAASLP